MSVIIVIVLTAVIMAGIWFLTKKKDVTEETDIEINIFDAEKAREFTEQWIKSEASTYVFDGYDLQFLKIEKVKKGGRYELTFSFTSRAAGYGDRADEMAAQVITPHIIEVIVEKEKVVRAITDGVYDEIKHVLIEPETRMIFVYFMEVIEGEEQITEAIREIPFTGAPGGTAIEELLKGPSVEEKALGLSTAIPAGTKLLSIDIRGGVARVDFSKQLEKGVTGSARVTVVRNQIEKTLLQFESVSKVIIMIEGENEEILQP